MSDMMYYDERLDLIAREAEIQALVSEREGMLAENTHRLSCGHSIAYSDEAFQANADNLREVQNVQWKYRKETP